MKSITAIALSLFTLQLSAQAGYWQNHVEYKMDIDMNVEDNTFNGEQWLTFTNNSPDTITEVYYHLYFNAFQPGSMMDTRSRNIPDPDGRVKDRIFHLSTTEVGFHEILSLKQDGQAVNYSIEQTVMKVELQRPIIPGDASVFHMTFHSQVPVQIRRSGRDNKEDVEYSMSQWYPKMAMYDEDGWHPDPYIGREFYAEFGSFLVNIKIDKDYVVGGTGILQNPEAVGHGYAPEPARRVSDKITYTFFAENVHDFAWAADPDFIHETVELANGMPVHFFYQEETANVENWKKLQETVPSYFNFMSEHFGQYAYPQFSVIQAGDGGMEYPMCTFVLGGGDEWEGFLGLFVHEATHNWYYGMLGTNETNYPWMDEGFTTFAEDEFMAEYTNNSNIHQSAYRTYAQLDASGLREPMSTPGDHFNHNFAYSISSYYMGSMFLNQMRSVVGEEAFWNGMMRYYDTWRFKHPKPEDFLRVMERESGMVLDWYLSYWKDQTKTIDYAVDTVLPMGEGATLLRLANNGQMPMPVDVVIELEGGTEIMYTIPLVMMHGHKPEGLAASPWPWTHPTYELEINQNIRDIRAIRINPKGQVADLNRDNDTWESSDSE